MADEENKESVTVTEEPASNLQHSEDKQSAESEGDKSSPNSAAKKRKARRKKKKKNAANSQGRQQTASESESHSESELKDLHRKEARKLKTQGDAVEQDKMSSGPKQKEVEEESEDEGIEDLGNPEELDGAGRNTLYERAKQYESKGKKKCALKCYLQCLTGLKDTTGFSLLPQCLRRVADLYFEKEEFEKAIQFIQAEKMFYETALIDTSQLQTKLELAQQGKEVEEGASGEDAIDPESLRADEYEKLARLCLEKQQPKLALEYQGKATKLRQTLYGDADSRTIASLDFFTVLYAEVGKQQYAESLEKAEKEAETQESPTSILRRRKKEETGDGGEKKQVRFENPPVTREQSFQSEERVDEDERERRAEHEEWVAGGVVLLLLLACALCLAAVAATLYCRLRPAALSCTTARIHLRHMGNVLGYWWHRLSHG